MQDKDTRGSLSDTFNQFGATPKEGAWEAIARELDEPKSKRRAVIWWWASGLAASLIIVWTMTFLFSTPDNSTNNLTNESPVKQYITGNSLPDKNTSNVGATNKKTQHLSSRTTLADAVNSSTFLTSFEKKLDHLKVLVPEQIPLPQIIPSPSTPMHDVDQHTIVASNTLTQRSDSLIKNDSTNAPRSEDSSLKNLFRCTYSVPVSRFYSKWRFGIAGEFGQTLPSTRPLIEPTLANDATFNSQGVLSFPQYDSTPYMSVFKGIHITVGKSFLTSRKLWLESGLTYQSFKSERLEELGPAQKGWLKHEAIGIPVQLSYQFIQSDKWAIAVSASLLNQWVYQSTQKIVASSVIMISSNEIPQNPIVYNQRFHLMSWSTGLDFSYAFNRRWQFSVQPQFRQYIGSAGNSQWPSTFRRGWMGGTVGLRLKL